MTKIAFVVGEESGDRIGADLIRSLRGVLGARLEVVGLGGEAMRAEGLHSLFPTDELSIIGIGAILARLPQLLMRLGQISGHIVDQRPDLLVIIDSPTFSHRVARRVRKAVPTIPIVNYVPPTIWAWRPERARAMTAYVDHAICLFPFEPETMRRFGGPPATYVGHPLMSEPHLARIISAAASGEAERRAPSHPPGLLILPGSRRGEIDRLLDDFGAVLAVLAERVPGLRATLAAVPRLRPEIERRVANWRVKPEIVSGEDEKWRAFASADAALAASGTVALELALAGIPMALAYKLDPIGYRFRHLITGWTAALPNFISDHPLVPEHFHEMVRPEYLARRLERLLSDTPERRAQIEGFADIRRKMAVERPPGDAAASIIARMLDKPTEALS